MKEHYKRGIIETMKGYLEIEKQNILENYQGSRLEIEDLGN